ncbi:hypothetical protein MAA8898_03790 [Maliponia aquimaris]|uniref:Uncharacterized protein n=1 Tax=Maliponia aquimaris TaxID=1673631 RepID=A0A238L0B4_9RHOB|nr:hypothetical protein MAA8898_03790 [Maliponia aquimaris]
MPSVALSLNQRAALLSIVMLAVGLLVWETAIPAQKPLEELTEHERLMGLGQERAGVPPPSQVLAKAREQLSNPFCDAGLYDKGIGIQIGYSIYRVLSGCFMAALVTIPPGFLIGTRSSIGIAWLVIVPQRCSWGHRDRLLRLERVEQPRPDFGHLFDPHDRCRRHAAGLGLWPAPARSPASKMQRHNDQTVSVDRTSEPAVPGRSKRRHDRVRKRKIRHREGRIRLHPGPLGLWQVDQHEHPRRSGRTDLGRGQDGRLRRVRTQPRPRRGVPELFAAALALDAEERDLRGPPDQVLHRERHRVIAGGRSAPSP